VRLFERAKTSDPSVAQTADLRIRSAKLAKTKSEVPGMVIHSNLAVLNSKMNEYGMGFMGNTLVFTSTRMEAGDKIDKTTGQGFARLYHAAPDDENWVLNGKLSETLNSAFNTGTFCYHQPSATAYFAQCNGYDGKSKTCKIFSSVYDPETKGWSKPEALSFNSESFNCSHPAISTDGNTLFFSSDKPGGYGKKDLYKSLKGAGNQWSEPINLGKEINGPGDEVFPTVSGDTLLVFSTDSREGLGGLDIYLAEMVNGNPKNPRWAEIPFNSPGDDFNLIFKNSKLEGFYCSNRPGGMGGDDIYIFKIDPRFKTVAGYVRDEKTGIPIANAKVKLYGTDNTVIEVETNESGKFTLRNANPEAGYNIQAKGEGFFTNNVKIDPIILKAGENPETKLKERNGVLLNLTKIPRGEIKLDNIYYAYNSAELTPESRLELMKLVKLLNENPEINIMINAHTDEIGSEKYNYQLSDKRAKSVVDFLTDNGIDRARLQSKGWGESSPVNPGAVTEEEHAANRRTTFQVTNLKSE
jgi:peptidoglycan-associated lipoprotein